MRKERRESRNDERKMEKNNLVDLHGRALCDPWGISDVLFPLA